MYTKNQNNRALVNVFIYYYSTLCNVIHTSRINVKKQEIFYNKNLLVAAQKFYVGTLGTMSHLKQIKVK